MSDTRVSVLTPPGSGAIATVRVSGSRAWELARQLFHPASKKPLPGVPELHRFWFGTLGNDEVVLAATEGSVEIHCHGGRRVVRWVVEQLLAGGVRELPECDSRTKRESPAHLLPRATTLRAASILLDQHHGAFDHAISTILSHLDSDHPERAVEPLAELARFAPAGRHLVEPWKVVIAGPPNVGKSSLVNALAGYQRSVVSEIAGTTRDVVTVPVAFDGWPVELTDTAGLRDAAGLEAEGIDRAWRVLSEADLVVWLVDASNPEPIWPQRLEAPRSPGVLMIMSKCDLPYAWESCGRGMPLVSAVTGDGIPGLVAEIARRLVPLIPPPGAAVPFTPEHADAIEAAHTALANPAAGAAHLAAALLRAAFPT